MWRVLDATFVPLFSDGVFEVAAAALKGNTCADSDGITSELMKTCLTNKDFEAACLRYFNDKSCKPPAHELTRLDDWQFQLIVLMAKPNACQYP